MSEPERDEAMAALGRPVPESAPRRSTRSPVLRMEDGVAIFLAVLFAVPAGLLIGYEVVVSVAVLVAAGVLTVAGALACGRPVLPSVIAGFVSCALTGLIGVPILVLRIIGGIWA